MNTLVKWLDSERFDFVLERGVYFLFGLSVIVCLPFILWNGALWLFH
ncbi:hypothetical protein [Bacillus sp. FJAT-42376]|nr:hypothetical protein [Bacillus sp. FJAT-42376]